MVISLQIYIAETFRIFGYFIDIVCLENVVLIQTEL